MNNKTKQWESYVDGAGRRHWRWPATAPLAGATAGTQRRPLLALPRGLELQLLPLQLRGSK